MRRKAKTTHSPAIGPGRVAHGARLANPPDEFGRRESNRTTHSNLGLHISVPIRTSSTATTLSQ